ncbi:MAG: Hpt domain-containing protein, partial [Cyanobacteria bacterium J06636_16]
MSNAADREVWLNFLDEVDEYLNTIESVLIGLAETGIDSQRMAAALRAVHTIKGIGSMIECPSLSQLSHRFEDALKIVTARRDSIQVDTALEMLLLRGIDSMRQISSRHRQALPIAESWLSEYAHPIYEQLQARLGEIQPSDELSLLAEESDTDTTIVMFETEVEELLGRLETVLADPALPCLQEELEMMVEELHDLGKMLQLDAFTSLCESIHQALMAASPLQVESIARQALELWQRSHALVMIGKLDRLPTQLESVPGLKDAFPPEIETLSPGFMAVLDDLPLPEESPDFAAVEPGFDLDDFTAHEEGMASPPEASAAEDIVDSPTHSDDASNSPIRADSANSETHIHSE